jgi:hypothetical protein
LARQGSRRVIQHRHRYWVSESGLGHKNAIVMTIPALPGYSDLKPPLPVVDQEGFCRSVETFLFIFFVRPKYCFQGVSRKGTKRKGALSPIPISPSDFPVLLDYGTMGFQERAKNRGALLMPAPCFAGTLTWASRMTGFGIWARPKNRD